MRRLVYSPKIYSYIRTDKGTVNVSDDITRFSVNRRINQVSQATMVLQNLDRRYTDPNVVFHPMDPITIFMQRIPGRPIQTFTGYLDESPYLQLYPGEVELRASCTLKKLLHTYWDPGLPFTNEFMKQYGWEMNYATGEVLNLNADRGAAKNSEPTDGSFANILFGVLQYVGGWDEKSILVEKLPKDFPERVAEIYSSLKPTHDKEWNSLQEFFQKVIGEGQYPAGTPGAAAPGGATGLIDGPVGKQIFCFFKQNGFTDQQAAGWVGNAQQESGLNPASPGGYLLQWQGGRAAALGALANKMGKPITDLGVQLNFVMQELGGTEASAAPAIRAAPSIAAATTAICTGYERAGIPMMDKRIQYATSAYNQFRGQC